MKKNIILAALILAGIVSCNTTHRLSDNELAHISWSAFCKAYGYNERTDHTNERAVNDYLDCWRGSVAEEEAFHRLGINPYE